MTCGGGDPYLMRFMYGGMCIIVCPWLPLATIDLVGDNREFEV